jgi:hypothetical protein
MSQYGHRNIPGKMQAIGGTARTLHTNWLPLLVLVALTLVTQLASVSYSSTQAFSDIFLPSTAALLAVTMPLAASGLWLGSKIGLGTPLLKALLNRSPDAGRQLGRDTLLAVSLGLSTGLLLWILRIVSVEFLPPNLPELGHRGAIGGLLVSISAAIGEEVWLRLGVMTTLAWLIMRTLGQPVLGPKVAWTAIVTAALGFGAIHLPQLAAAGAATTIGIAATMLGNTLVGIVCGWLFWRRGLVAAILAHFSIDVVLHVLPTLLVPIGDL